MVFGRTLKSAVLVTSWPFPFTVPFPTIISFIVYYLFSKQMINLCDYWKFDEVENFFLPSTLLYFFQSKYCIVFNYSIIWFEYFSWTKASFSFTLFDNSSLIITRRGGAIKRRKIWEAFTFEAPIRQARKILPTRCLETDPWPRWILI